MYYKIQFKRKDDNSEWQDHKIPKSENKIFTRSLLYDMKSLYPDYEFRVVEISEKILNW